jgi:acyl-CoA synthetase (AMP-forming)/AMP-acid ligase II
VPRCRCHVLLDGELYVTGRCKDLIIVGGRNHYPHDLEATAERAHDAVRTDCVAAFSIEADDAEKVVLVVGVGRRATAADKRGEVADTVRTAISSAHGITVYDVVLVRPNAVPKTSSGKLQRGACRAAYLRGDYQHDDQMFLPGGGQCRCPYRRCQR